MRQSTWISVGITALGFALGCTSDNALTSPPATLEGSGGVAPAPLGTGGLPAATGGLDITTGGMAAPPQITGGDGTPNEPMPTPDAGVEPMGPHADAATPTAMHDYVDQVVMLTANLVVAPGEVLRVGPGTTFVASPGVAIIVEGTLIVEGSTDAPVSFEGAGTPRSWQGIVIENGGNLDAHDVRISGATYGIRAMPGSDFTVDHADIGTSFKAAVVESDGSFDHTAFHASGDPTFSLSSEAPITDPNGTLTIIDGSPQITNSTFDNGAALVDMIRVRGNSTARFEHLHITDAHCGIHTEDGTNTAPVIRDCIFEGMAFGIMAYATAPDVQDSVFLNNATDVGFCLGATAANVPRLQNNHYSSGALTLDAACAQIGTTDPSPAATPNPAAGPVQP